MAKKFLSESYKKRLQKLSGMIKENYEGEHLEEISDEYRAGLEKRNRESRIKNNLPLDGPDFDDFSHGSDFSDLMVMVEPDPDEGQLVTVKEILPYSKNKEIKDYEGEKYLSPDFETGFGLKEEDWDSFTPIQFYVKNQDSGKWEMIGSEEKGVNHEHPVIKALKHPSFYPRLKTWDNLVGSTEGGFNYYANGEYASDMGYEPPYNGPY